MNDIINGLIEIAATLGDFVVYALPMSPFSGLEARFSSEMLGYINFYIPVREMLDIGMAWVTAIVLWYLYSILLRWVKAIE